MDFLTVQGILEASDKLKREVISLKHDNDALSWKCKSTVNVSYNSVTRSNVNRLCLLNHENTNILYINHSDRFTYDKIALNDVNTLVIT